MMNSMNYKKPTGDPYVPWRSLDGREFSKVPDVETVALFAIRIVTFLAAISDLRSVRAMSGKDPAKAFRVNRRDTASRRRKCFFIHRT